MKVVTVSIEARVQYKSEYEKGLELIKAKQAKNLGVITDEDGDSFDMSTRQFKAMLKQFNDPTNKVIVFSNWNEGYCDGPSGCDAYSCKKQITEEQARLIAETFCTIRDLESGRVDFDDL